MHELGHVIGIAHSKERKLMYYYNTYCLGKTCPPTERNIYDFLAYYFIRTGVNPLIIYVADVQIKKKLRGEVLDEWAVELLSPE